MSEELTQAQKLQLKREQRRAKILAAGESRLNKIVSTYSGSTEDMQVENAEPHGDEASDANEGDVPADLDSSKLETKLENAAENSKQVESDQPVEKEIITPKQTEFGNMIAKDMELPALEDPFEYVEQTPIVSAVMDTLGWIHAVLFSLFSTIAFATWIVYHKHETFALGTEKDVWYLQMCRQLDYMANHPVHYDIGASSHVRISDYIMPAWGMFFTFEVVLFSIRLFQMKRTNTQKFTIPEIMKPAMIQFGFNPSFYEGLISSVWDYIDMYNTFCNDMYVVVFLMGTAVTIATVAQTGFQLCS
ncbi:hypothetical protein HDV06_000053 [Boothiomyces sp. JEL0866]|nr:hypothetical protein HDV06_000053 [Boothiomyces sp. JEL0866]